MDFDLLKLDSTFFAGFALIYTALQMRANGKQKRAQYITDFLKSFWTDTEILEAYYLFEYSEFRYDENFHGSILERKVDRLLECFGILAKLYKAGLVPLEDANLLRYEILTVYEDEELGKYFEFVDQHFKRRKMACRAFDEFRSLGEKLSNSSEVKD